MIVIGICGKFGAGKGEAVTYFKKKGFIHYSVRSFLIDEIKKKGLPVNRDSMTIVSNDLRKEQGTDFIIKSIYEKAIAEGKNCIIESIRNPGEVNFLKKQSDFFLLGVDADQKIRYNRIARRNSETDQVTFEKFVTDEQREFKNDDPVKQNIHACMQQTDMILVNNGSLDDFRSSMDIFYKKVVTRA